jgi:hypothetical protein
MTSFPPNFIPIVDAFNEAVEKLALPVAAGPDISLPGTAEFEDEFDVFAQRQDEAARAVERLMRDALADGDLDPWVVGPTGMEILFDGVDGRESWRQEALGAPGFEHRTHHLTSPGPNDDRAVFLDRTALRGWIAGRRAASVPGARRPGRPSTYEWSWVEERFVEQCDFMGGTPCPKIGDGWSTQADAENFVSDKVLERSGKRPAPSTVREHVVDMIRKYEGR